MIQGLRRSPGFLGALGPLTGALVLAFAPYVIGEIQDVHARHQVGSVAPVLLAEASGCGDGERESGEECDDGNADNGDCCDANCQFEAGCCMILLPGDINNDGRTTSADILYSVNFIFKGGWPPIPCLGMLDVNCSGAFTSADILFLVEYMFKSGSAPCDICNDSPLASDCIA
jgi:cysteine-rich repeat protein